MEQTETGNAYRGRPTHIIFGNESLSDLMLKSPLRGYIMEKVKAPLMTNLIRFANRFPNPTRQNCKHPNSLVWLRVWDKFFQMEDNPGREPLFKAIRRVYLAALEGNLPFWANIPIIRRLCLWATRRVHICEQEHDPYYRDRMQCMFEFWLEEVLNGNWKPRSLDHPWECWKNDYRGKGYEFLKERYYHKEKYKE